MRVQLGNFYIFFETISLHFYLIYILCFWHLKQSPCGWCSLTAEHTQKFCIWSALKTSWKQDRIPNRCRQCFMESVHELSPSTRTPSSYILFVPLNVCLSKVPLLSMLSPAAAALEWVRTALMNPSALSPLNTKRVLLQSPVVWELSKREMFTHSKNDHTLPLD